jgi:DNA-3-methyladenine glycosylase
MVKSFSHEFFQRDPLVCARELIGCTFGFADASGVIVETEAYASENDRACHTWKRAAAREFVDIHAPGSAYVYLNYGMHWLFNFLVKGGGREGFVLIRALEPLHGIPLMRSRRKREHLMELCSGPAKLTQALGIDGSLHGSDLFVGNGLCLGKAKGNQEVVVSRRIGITLDAEYPWRFLRKGCPFVSVTAGVNSPGQKKSRTD